MSHQPYLSFNLAEADLTTALRVAEAINKLLGPGQAVASDAVTVRISAPLGAQERVAMMGMIENIDVDPAEAPARVIVNARTGTVVINGAVRLGAAAITHGKLDRAGPGRSGGGTTGAVQPGSNCNRNRPVKLVSKNREQKRSKLIAVPRCRKLLKQSTPSAFPHQI